MLRYLYSVLVFLILCYLVWPYTSILRFYIALKGQDHTAINKMVDWPRVRHSLSTEINKIIANKINLDLKQSLQKNGIKTRLGFTRVSEIEKFIFKIGTSKGLILLFKSPDQVGCFGNLQGISDPTLFEICYKEVIVVTDKHRSHSLKGPNFARVYKKTNYLFFTDLFTFKFDVMHNGFRTILVFKRAGLSWKLTKISIERQLIERLFNRSK